MHPKNDLTNLDCTIIIKTIENRRFWLNSALELYDNLYKGLKIAIVETTDNENFDLKRFNNLDIMYKWGPNYSCEGALYELIKLVKTKYVIEQGDDDLILMQRLQILVEIAKISKCEIVSFESVLINEIDRKIFCKKRFKNNFKKSLKISSLALKRGLYQSTPNSSFYLNKEFRLNKFKKKYMMTAFSIIETEVAKKLYTLDWLPPKGHNGIGEVTASLHAYVGFKTIRVPIIAFLRLITMNELSPAAKERNNLYKSDISKEYAINYFKLSAPYLNLKYSDIKDNVFKRLKPLKKSLINNLLNILKIKTHRVLVSLVNAFLSFF